MEKGKHVDIVTLGVGQSAGGVKIVVSAVADDWVSRLHDCEVGVTDMACYTSQWDDEEKGEKKGGARAGSEDEERRRTEDNDTGWAIRKRR